MITKMNNKWIKINYFLVGTVIAITVIILNYFYKLYRYNLTFKNKVYPNVFIDNQDFSGFTKMQIIEYFSKASNKLQDKRFTAIYKDQPISTFSASGINLKYDGETAAEQAYLIGRSSHALSRFYQVFSSLIKIQKYQLLSNLNYNHEPIKEFVSKSEESYNKPARNALFKFENGKVTSFRNEEKGLKILSDQFLMDFDENIKNLKDQFEGMTELFVNAKPLIKKLPHILGSKEERVYLVLYQNDKERRATGGFLTFYAVFKINKGKMTIHRSDDIYSLDAEISNHPKAPREILTYHKGVSQFYIRDSNLSPDFVESIKLFEGLNQKSGAKVVYDGIITLDSKILVDMLTIFGDVEVNGIRFSAKIDKRCDCPEAIYTLFDLVDRPVNYVKVNRKGIMGDLMYRLFYNALGFSPSKYWGTLIQTMFKNLDEKHILVYFKDAETQKSLEQLNFAGRIRDFKGDFLHINNVNFAGAKSNMFVSESIESKTNGSEREVTIVFKNPYPASDCNLERGGLCLNATLRNWIRFYVPEGSKLISLQGSTKKVQTYDELGKTVFEGFLEIMPMGQGKVIVKYTLPSTVDTKNYSLLVQKQPGVMEQKLKVSFNNKSLFDGLLITDKIVK